MKTGIANLTAFNLINYFVEAIPIGLYMALFVFYIKAFTDSIKRGFRLSVWMLLCSIMMYGYIMSLINYIN